MASNGKFDTYEEALDGQDIEAPLQVWQYKLVGEVKTADTDIVYRLNKYEAAFVMIARMDEEGSFTFDVPSVYGDHKFRYTVTVEREEVTE